MRKVLLLTVLLILGANAWAGHHKNFKTTAYVMVQDVNRVGTVKEWEALWPDYSKNLGAMARLLQESETGQGVSGDLPRQCVCR